MKYQYIYRTSDNRRVADWISAKDRAEVYAKLKERGIRPSQVIGRDPVHWRRWTGIVILSSALLVAVLLLVREKGARTPPRLSEDRAQLYGDPSTIQKLAAEGWSKSFPDLRDAWFARHAIPAANCDCEKTDIVSVATIFVSTNGEMKIDAGENLDVVASDAPELAKMKRMINGMKKEFRTYVDAGGSVPDYIRLCDERLDRERKIVDTAKKEFAFLRKQMAGVKFEKLVEMWDVKNERLRAMGLPTVALPED